MGLPAEELHKILSEKLPQAIVEGNLDGVEPYLVVKPECIEEVSLFCRDDGQLKFDLLSVIAGVDYPKDEIIEIRPN